jgi:LysR family transcriptional activator of nhaA
VPPIVVRDELDSGILVEHCRIPEVTERFHAIVMKRRFPNRLLVEVLGIAEAALSSSAGPADAAAVAAP